MAVTTDIVATWRRPGTVMRRLLSMGRREDRALAMLIAACLVIFVAQWPRLSREAFFDPSVPLEARLGGALLGWLFIAPLMAYAVAAIGHLLALIVKGKGSWYSSRLALFWSLLSTSPAFLFYGLVAGFIGPGIEQSLAGGLLLIAFLAIWGLCLREAEREPEAGA
ncbi:MAG: YIP1 family protein [Roseicyclus sp.]|uniref:YIP1 family protein n=1 Tax=Roseicyclus sp. TaxID=1914329 RepID=UPI003A8376AA